jgi:hypothetical protein
MGLFDRFGKKSDAEVSPGGSTIHRHSSEDWKRPQLGFVGKSAELGKIRDEIYQRRFGEATKVWHELIPLVPHIDVFEYNRPKLGDGVCTLVTSGMSDLPMNTGRNADVPKRVEIIFYCREPRKEYADTMRWLAHFPHDQNTWIGAFHTIPNGNPPESLWGTEMDTAFFLPPLVKTDQTLKEELVLDGDPVELLWLTPLTARECELKLAQGASAILDMFKKHRHPFVFDPNRKSYV